MLAVACPSGIYIGQRNDTHTFRKVLDLRGINSIAALPEHNRLFVHVEGALMTYSLEVATRVAMKQAPPAALTASLERLGPKTGTVQFVRVGYAFNRGLVVYCVKTLLNTTVHCMEVLPPWKAPSSMSFQEYGKAFYVPNEALDVTFLNKSLAVANERGITIVNPEYLQAVVTVPDFQGPDLDMSIGGPGSILSAKCASSKALGIVPVGDGDLLVLYTDFGTWVTKHGFPSRRARFVRWEAPAIDYAFRMPYILLFSAGAGFIEVRDVRTGRLVQCIQGTDVRLSMRGPLGPAERSPVLVTMRDVDVRERDFGAAEVLIELLETAPLSTTPSSPPVEQLFQEFGI